MSTTRSDPELLDLLDVIVSRSALVQIKRNGDSVDTFFAGRAGYGSTVRESLSNLADNLANTAFMRLTK